MLLTVLATALTIAVILAVLGFIGSRTLIYRYYDRMPDRRHYEALAAKLRSE